MKQMKAFRWRWQTQSANPWHGSASVLDTITAAVETALAVREEEHELETKEAVRKALELRDAEHAAELATLRSRLLSEKKPMLELATFTLPTAAQVKDEEAALQHCAGRHPRDQLPPVTVAKAISGLTHKRAHPDGSVRETMVVGAACSELFSGPVLGEILKPGVELQQQVVQGYLRGHAQEHGGKDKKVFVPPLFIHTSAGLAPALAGFTNSMRPHLPASWTASSSDGDGDGDWMLSLQLDGASAVHAAYDTLLQLQQCRGRTDIASGRRMLCAVGARSYHGPGSSSFGATDPLRPGTAGARSGEGVGKRHQISYPVPTSLDQRPSETEAAFHARCSREFAAFLDAHAADVAVLFVEPQWGSSAAAQPWPRALLAEYVAAAKARGILVCADEIMCGLGRHGEGGRLFLSDAWGLDVDAVTFGKAIAGGAFPLSGVVFAAGAAEFEAAGRKPMQSHTYAHGAQVLPLLAGAEALRRLPAHLPHVAAMGAICVERFAAVEEASGGVVRFHGQGLMWGGLLTVDDPAQRAAAAVALRRHCDAHRITPYFIPIGGFMFTPVLDVGEAELREALRRIEAAVVATVDELPLLRKH